MTLARPRLLACTAAATACVYALWNLAWLAHGVVPPSLFLALTGLPSPTTGGTRAILALRDGHILESLRYNPMTIPLLVLLLASLTLLASRAARRQRIILPSGFGVAWAVLLAVAWVLKLIARPRYG